MTPLPPDPLTEILAERLPSPAEVLVPLAAAAKQLNQDPKSLIKRIRRTGEIPVVRVGRAIMLRPSDLARLTPRPVNLWGGATR